ncbi:hypothetical protein SAMN04487939_11241 [Lysobacter sp. yr284]|uniref:hypothetical protein n=1 Tax=Lysobacter TaxID=68 RepID=UPI0008977B4B|nr:hypothetical protein [Lysobacter sp. yr284]SDZ01961.1 hypothetical protein SAMN04487939_11241 [Lysobacter sp. yr284]
MFDRSHLIAHWRQAPPAPAGALDIVEFGPGDFSQPASGQAIGVVRGERATFAEPLHFWIAAQRAGERFGARVDGAQAHPGETRYIEAALCQPIDRAVFARIVGEYAAMLRAPLPAFVREPEGWRRGLRMYQQFNDVAALVETDRHYFVFAWTLSG